MARRMRRDGPVDEFGLFKTIRISFMLGLLINLLNIQSKIYRVRGYIKISASNNIL